MPNTKRHKTYICVLLDAAFAAGQRALKAGMSSPLVYFADAPANASNLAWTFEDADDYKQFLEVTMLGMLEASYEPIDVREHATRVNKPIAVFSKLGVIAATSLNDAQVDNVIRQVSAIEMGRRVSKGNGG